jgi:hypothetical protein
MGVVGLFRRLKEGICGLFARFVEDLFWLFRRFWFPDGNFWYVAGRWMEEPIGVVVPFVALLILLLAPQMHDMFVGISGSTWYDITWAEIGFAVSAAFLGFSSWYWTRAALAAPFKEDDTTERGTAQHPLQDPTGAVAAERPIAVKIFFALPLVLVILLQVTYLNDMVSRPIDNIINLCILTIFVALFAGGWWFWHVGQIPLSSPVPAQDCRLLDKIAEKRDAARLKAPRIAIVFALLIALSPVIAFIFRLIRSLVDPDQNLSELNYQAIPWFGSFFGAILVFAVYGFATKRMDWQCRAASRAEWLWRATAWPPLGWPAAIIAAAPFGWIFAASLFLFSIVGIVFTAFNRFYFINAPSAALLSLALAVPIFVLMLAFSRDLVYFSLPVVLALWRWITGKTRLAVTNANEFDGLIQHYTLRPNRHLFTWSARLGFVILVIVMFGPSLTGLGDHLYEVRTTGNTLVEPVQGSPSDQQEQITPARPSADPPADLPALRRPNFEEALEAWYRERVSGHPADRPMPVIIVAAEGGASRAAVWMLRAMKLLDEETKLSDKELRGDFGRYLFGIVGVSGGSLGAVTYLQAAALQAAGNDGTAASGLDWSKKKVENGLSAMAKSDLLSASITTYFLNDSVGLIATPIWVAFGLPDRAKALEAFCPPFGPVP